MNKFLFLSEYSQPIYKKCELCKRVKDVLFRLDVTNSEAAKMIVIAILLIVRIETKLEGLTNAIIQLSDVIKPTCKDQ